MPWYYQSGHGYTWYDEDPRRITAPDNAAPILGALIATVCPPVGIAVAVAGSVKGSIDEARSTPPDGGPRHRSSLTPDQMAHYGGVIGGGVSKAQQSGLEVAAARARAQASAQPQPQPQPRPKGFWESLFGPEEDATMTIFGGGKK